MTEEMVPAPNGVLDRQLVALTPQELPAAQQSLVDWCRAKVAALEQEVHEYEQAREEARLAKWSQRRWVSLVTRTKARVAYYQKMLAAVEAGYLLVPNFPIDAFAIRVRRPPGYRESQQGWVNSFQESAERLPAGKGEYVSPGVKAMSTTRPERKSDGSMGQREWKVSTQQWSPVDFPVAAVRPEVLAQTRVAMARRIFDEVGLVQNQVAGDPIVVGRILDPRGNGRCSTFFLAWWLDITTL